MENFIVGLVFLFLAIFCCQMYILPRLRSAGENIWQSISHFFAAVFFPTFQSLWALLTARPAVTLLVIAGVTGSLIAMRIYRQRREEQKRREETLRRQEMERRQREEEAQRAKKEHAIRLQTEQQELQTRQAACAAAIATLRLRLEEDVKKLKTANQQAAFEYTSHAYAPFWDKIEQATRCLVDFQQHLQSFSEQVNEYDRATAALSARQVQPRSPIPNRSAPNPQAEIDQLRKLIRQGQTDFHFSDTWENRKTRETIRAGFAVLAKSIDALGSGLSYSVNDLGQEIERALAAMKK